MTRTFARPVVGAPVADAADAVGADGLSASSSLSEEASSPAGSEVPPTFSLMALIPCVNIYIYYMEIEERETRNGVRGV